MKSSLFLCVMVALTLVLVFEGHSGEKTKKLQSLHRKIGNDLIKIKKEHPKSQTLVYSLLDQLGEYYSVSKKIISRKKEYKKLLQAEVEHNESAKKEMSDMRENIGKMKKLLVSANKRLKSGSAQVEELKTEKETLSKEKEEFLREKEGFETEKERFIVERDALTRERDALVREKDALIRERDSECNGKIPSKKRIAALAS